eukprot:scaffold69281_cov26-Tisochrysis_lutea.AAC.6
MEKGRETCPSRLPSLAARSPCWKVASGLVHGAVAARWSQPRVAASNARTALPSWRASSSICLAKTSRKRAEWRKVDSVSQTNSGKRCSSSTVASESSRLHHVGCGTAWPNAPAAMVAGFVPLRHLLTGMGKAPWLALDPSLPSGAASTPPSGPPAAASATLSNSQSADRPDSTNANSCLARPRSCGCSSGAAAPPLEAPTYPSKRPHRTSPIRERSRASVGLRSV